MDHTPDNDDLRQRRIEEILYIIGGCEVAIRNNNKPEFRGAYVAEYGRQFGKMQKTYLKKLERLMNGLSEDES